MNQLYAIAATALVLLAAYCLYMASAHQQLRSCGLANTKAQRHRVIGIAAMLLSLLCLFQILGKAAAVFTWVCAFMLLFSLLPLLIAYLKKP